jgi:zinc transport system permease protein
MEIFSDLLQYNFLLHAFWAALFASIICGIIGTYIVSNRLVFLSGGITHSSFGGIGIAYYMGGNPLIGAAIFSVLSALGIEYFSRNGRLRQDSAIGIWWSFGMAVGIIFIYLTPGYTPNLMTYLFGSILTVSYPEIMFMAMLTLIVVSFFIIFYRNILYISFDEEYAFTNGVPVKLLKYILISLVGLTIVINIKVVGIILLISLLTIPQSIANLFTKTFKSIIFWSIGIAFIGILTGLIVSYQLDVPSGASIIFALVLFFLAGKLLQLFKHRLIYLVNEKNQ